MLSLEEIRDIRFHRAFKGYMPEEVDEFIEGVISAFEATLNAHAADKLRLAQAEQHIEEFHTRERSVGEALVVAQEQAGVVIREAEARAEQIVAEAHIQAQKILDEAEEKAAVRQAEMDALSQAAAVFKERLMDIYRTQLVAVEAMPNGASDLPPEEEAEPEEVVEATALCVELHPEMPEEAPEAPVEETPESVSEEIAPEEPEKLKEVPVASKAPALFDADQIDESKSKPGRFLGLQFGTEYEEPFARKWFRRKK
ncbi:MAG: DivIVA domain-containing protein [Clostridia bacterium]|nr:DivIVA domain-containing protein [Clostridia bacterium]